VSAGTSPREPVVRGETRGKHRSARPNGGHRHAPGAPRMPLSPWGWWVLAAPAAPVPGPPVVIIQQAPGVIQADPAPPPASEPPYYWYACGPVGPGPFPRAPATGYCLGGLTPSHTGRPNPGKTLEQFQADIAACQDWASAHAAILPAASASMQGRYDSAYQQCLQAAGHQVPGDVVSGQTAYPSPPPTTRVADVPPPSPTPAPRAPSSRAVPATITRGPSRTDALPFTITPGPDPPIVPVFPRPGTE